jgi:hypothetical protein
MRIRIIGEAEFEDSEYETLLKNLQKNRALLGIGSRGSTTEKELHISEIAILIKPDGLANK